MTLSAYWMNVANDLAESALEPLPKRRSPLQWLWDRVLPTPVFRYKPARPWIVSARLNPTWSVRSRQRALVKMECCICGAGELIDGPVRGAHDKYSSYFFPRFENAHAHSDDLALTQDVDRWKNGARFVAIRRRIRELGQGAYPVVAVEE